MNVNAIRLSENRRNWKCKKKDDECFHKGNLMFRGKRYKMYSPSLKFGTLGHFITMDLADRLILLQNDILEGKFQNKNSSEILKALCQRVNMKLEINKGIAI